MDDAIDASHDNAQHSAASALATMDCPPALGRSPDLTGLSSDEVQMPLWFFNHSNMAVFMTVKNKLHEQDSRLGMSFETSMCMHLSFACSTLITKAIRSYSARSCITIGTFLFCIQQALLLTVVFCIVLHCTTGCDELLIAGAADGNDKIECHGSKDVPKSCHSIDKVECHGSKDGPKPCHDSGSCSPLESAQQPCVRWCWRRSADIPDAGSEWCTSHTCRAASKAHSC